MTTIYFAGGEDSEFSVSGGMVVSTTAGRFRSAYARCALVSSGVGSPGFAINWLPFSASTFWASCRFQTSSGLSTTATLVAVAFYDSSMIVRIRLVQVTTNTFKIEKVTAAGVATQLGSNFTITGGSVIPDKLDFFIVDAVSGTVNVYLNTIQVFTFSGDTTTDGVTSIAYIYLASMLAQNIGQTCGWSEVMVTDTDTRALNLQTLAPVANGNTHNFDTGSPAAANVNEITLNDATLDGSTTAGQIDEYTIPSLAAGTYGIIAVGVSARMTKGSSGPSKADLVVRSGTTDYLSADQSLTTAWQNYQNWWTTDPNTSAAWTALPVNVGIKSVT